MDKNTAQLRATFAKCCRTNKKAPIHKFRGNKNESGVLRDVRPYDLDERLLANVGHWLLEPAESLTPKYTLDGDKSWDAQCLGRAWRGGAMVDGYSITKIWFDELVNRRADEFFKHFQEQREKDMDRLRDQMAQSVTQPRDPLEKVLVI